MFATSQQINKANMPYSKICQRSERCNFGWRLEIWEQSTTRTELELECRKRKHLEPNHVDIIRTEPNTFYIELEQN